MAQLTGFLLVFLILSKITEILKNQEFNINGPFECGFNNESPTRIPFSFQFFTVMVLFLIFDTEVSILTPMPVEPIHLIKKMGILVFLVVLTGGLLYEWNIGKLE
jgi:NADH:ubiquinone oxidoreductase subunit 3 (subunit A)